MRNWTFGWGCQWGELLRFRRMAWINFDLFKICVETGTYKGWYVEIEVAILGICLVVEWHEPTSRSVFLADMDRRMAEVKDQLGCVSLTSDANTIGHGPQGGTMSQYDDADRLSEPCDLCGLPFADCDCDDEPVE